MNTTLTARKGPKKQIGKKLYRAVLIEGIVHGGGGIKQGHWHNSYVKAEMDLRTDKFTPSLGDNYRGVEVTSVLKADYIKVAA